MIKKINNNKKSVSKQISKMLFLFAFSLCIAAGASAQPEPDGEVDVPFDGGVSLLVAAGVAYGAKQWRNNRKANQEETTEL